MKNIKYNKSVADKISVKGKVAEDGMSIVYETEDDSEIIDIRKCLKLFIGEEVTLSIATKKDEDRTEDLTAKGNED